MTRVWIEDRANHADYRDRVETAKKAKRTPPGRWRVRWYDPSGKPKAKTFAKKTDADTCRSQVEHDLKGGEYQDPATARTRLVDVAEPWFAAKTDLEQGSRDIYRDHLDNYVLPRWGTVPVGAISFEDVAVWVGKLQSDPGRGGRPLAPATVRSIHLVLLSVLEWAVKTGKLRKNPARDVPLPKKPPRNHVYLSHVEVEQLACAAGEHGTLIRFLSYTGLRWSEASALTVGKIDLDARRAHVDRAYKDNKGTLTLGMPKTGEARSVPFPSFLSAELKPFVDGRDTGELVFTAKQGGPLWLRNWRPRAFRKAVDSAGLSGRSLTPHKLRHTAASLAIAAGADVYVVQKMLGHKKPSMTLDIYGHLWPDRLDEVANALDAKRAEHLT
ncbi:site-specific integrase [Nocardiopsis tropica]|uniref:Site-specific integrase n=1 Tax=Nocardiopsis tropica TaxID=109330 RepID=A0ABU7KL95_9ACTN|nr:site-specific integrase [Nocardiopsis umidischolae]MEE2050068.1 site-specific integrase [Nocardiopsis umidischolae]